MAANSKIEWTDRTWQLTTGCLHRSAGCAHCYAETMAARLKAMALADIAAGKDPGRKRHYIDVIDDDGRWNGRVVPVPEALADPLAWRKPSTVFVDSMSDLFYGDYWDELACGAKGIPFTPVPFDFLDRAFATMALTPRQTYQVLTKRADRLAAYLTRVALPLRVTSEAATVARERGLDPYPRLQWPLPNVWIGCSAENQRKADLRYRSLQHVPAAVRYWSLEPLLGMIDRLPLKGMHWVIVGGESGPGARPCRATWVRDIVRQCQDAGVAVFVKQLGRNAEEGRGVNRKLLLKHPKGGDPAEWPEDLRVRQMPTAAA